VVEDEAAQDEGLMELLQQLVCWPASVASLATAACGEGLVQAVNKEVGCGYSFIDASRARVVLGFFQHAFAQLIRQEARV
jgi:hypothetical protein